MLPTNETKVVYVQLTTETALSENNFVSKSVAMMGESSMGPDVGCDENGELQWRRTCDACDEVQPCLEFELTSVAININQV